MALAINSLGLACAAQAPSEDPSTTGTSSTSRDLTIGAGKYLDAGSPTVDGSRHFTEAVPALLPSSVPAAKSTWRGRLIFQELEEISRFNYMDSGQHEVNARDLQYRIRTRARVNFLESGSTYLQTRAETGKGFNNSWDNAGVGQSAGQDIFDVKTFALGQKIAAVELEAGGIEFDQGSGTQHTYASGDGALVGYRIKSASSGLVDKPIRLDFTLGYVGDFDRQNVFSRLHLDRVNYYQALVQQHFAPVADASLEVDSIQHVFFVRPAFHYHQLWHPVLDDLIVETVLRTNDDPRFAWSATLTRPLYAQSHCHLLVIYSDLPYNLYRKPGQAILYNQGEIDTGKRLSWGTNYSHDKKLDLGIFAGRRLDSTPSVRWVFQASIGYHYASLLNRLLH